MKDIQMQEVRVSSQPNIESAVTNTNLQQNKK